MKTLKTKELMEISGLSSRTLNRYQKRGWLPKPQFKSFGRYGAGLRWPESTVKQLLTIKSLKKCGHKNKAIDEVLKGAI
jgi:DNA-binding transcriptional MerR regulator